MVFHSHNISERMKNIGKNVMYFSNDLYTEHLEEASFLYENRLFLMNEPDGSWPDLERIENRTRSHIEALVMGDDLAIDLCREKIDEGRPGVLYIAVRVFCRCQRDDCVMEVLDGLDPGNPEQIKEVVDALNQDLPEEWHTIIRHMMTSGDDTLIGIASDIIGYRRLPMEDELLDVLNTCYDTRHDPVLSNIIRAIGRLRVELAHYFLSSLIRKGHPDDRAKHEAYLALLRIQEKNLNKSLMADEFAGNWRFLIMGLCGNSADVRFLQEISISPKICDESLLALGLLGDMSSIDILMDCLNDAPYSRAASLALNVLTGADLFEDVFIPEPIDEGNLFDDQLEKLKNGEPLYLPGEEPGDTINRLSQNPETWKTWWKNNKKGFEDRTFYRYGKPYSPSGIFKALESEKSPAFLRQLAYEELVIRYDKDVYFDITFPISDQRTALNTYKNWVDAYGRKS